MSGTNTYYYYSDGTTQEITQTTLSTKPTANICTSVTIGSKVTRITGSVFYNDLSNLTSVTFDSLTNVTTITGEWLFRDCIVLKSVTLPTSITGTLDGTFVNCQALTSVSLPPSITQIAGNMFEKCYALQSVTLPSTLNNISAYAFVNAGITSITLPNSLTSIGTSLFQACTSLTSVNIPTGITLLNDSMFNGCSSLSNITIPSNIKSIGSNVFTNNKFVNVVIPSSVTSIGQSCFNNNTLLTSIKLSKNITALQIDAFRNCTQLSYITIPNNVTSLGNNCFYGCSALKTFNFESGQKITSVGTNVYTNTSLNPIVNYYQTTNYAALSTALKNSQNQFRATPTYNYISTVSPAIDTGSTQYLTTPVQMQVSTNNTNVAYFDNSVDDMVYAKSTGSQFATNVNFYGILAKISVNAYNSSNQSITDFSSNNVNVSITLPMGVPGTNYKIFKLFPGTNTVMSYQPSGFPVVATWQSGQTWTASLPSLSSYFITLSTFYCVGAHTKILMGDGSHKEICDIQRGDEIMTDITTNKKNKVAKIYSFLNENKVAIIPKGSMGNNEELIISPHHPVWINNDCNRILPLNLENIKYTDISELYNIQFEDEDTYYAEGIKIDSLSPNSKLCKLEKEYYYDQTKFRKNLRVSQEDDPVRNKPKMVNSINTQVMLC